MSNERDISNEIISCSVHKRNLGAFKQIKLQMDVSEDRVTIAVGEGMGIEK